jgi:hypothetical protein
MEAFRSNDLLKRIKVKHRILSPVKPNAMIRLRGQPVKPWEIHSRASFVALVSQLFADGAAATRYSFTTTAAISPSCIVRSSARST